MHGLRYFLAGVIVTAALALSVVLILRNLPADPAVPPQAAAPLPAAPSAQPSPPETAPPQAQAQPPAAVPAPAPPPPAQSRRPDNLFDLESLPSPGFVGPNPYIPGMNDAGRAADAKPRSGPGRRLDLTSDQSARLRYVLLSHTIMQSEAPDFPLRLGAAVPKEVWLTPLPREVADAIPDYANYSYVIAQYQIVIVDTERREIDLLIPTG